VLSIYTPDTTGKLLADWMKEDWGLFRHDGMDSAHAKELLAEILDDGEIVRQQFLPIALSTSDTLDQWEKFRSELMYENRFFPQVSLKLERLKEHLSYLRLDEGELVPGWHRARIQEADAPFTPDQMGAPSKNRASHGRANPAGIPYLYLASTPVTAISELRPHTGEIACVVEVTIPAGLKIVDLRHPRGTVSPFASIDETAVALLRGDIEFLERLAEELTRPVLPQTAAIAYLPTQYLCEFVKKCGFDGVIYRSSVGDGVNLALFNPSMATFGMVTQHRVSRVSVEVAAKA
jgi:hypothetical protein